MFHIQKMYPICIPCRKDREHDDLLLMQNEQSETETEA